MTTHLTWQEVIKTHKSWSGISASAGTVKSLLCNQHKDGGYSDVVLADRIEYRVTATTLPADVRALVSTVGQQCPIRVFEKLGVNKWSDLGNWFVVDVQRTDNAITFILRPAEAATRSQRA